MDREIIRLANEYRRSYGSSGNVSDRMKVLYNHYIKKHDSALMDSAAAAAALYGIFMADQIDFSKITPQMEEAFNLAYPNVELSSLADLSPDQIEGYIAAWKGKYFEVLVRDQLNAGEWVGDIHLEPGQVAQLAESAAQTGWDLQILNSDGTIANEIQLKATDSLSYVKEALERYPDIQVLTTDEVDIPEELHEKILSSGFSNESLEKTIVEPMSSLFDTPLENFVEGILPGLPFVIIAVGETQKVLMGKKSYENAFRKLIERSAKTVISVGVGSIVYLLDGGIISLPATIITRLGIDRYQLLDQLGKHIDKEIHKTRKLLPAHT